jgi:hypothetical protein
LFVYFCLLYFCLFTFVCLLLFHLLLFLSLRSFIVLHPHSPLFLFVPILTFIFLHHYITACCVEEECWNIRDVLETYRIGSESGDRMGAMDNTTHECWDRGIYVEALPVIILSRFVHDIALRVSFVSTALYRTSSDMCISCTVQV